MNYVILYVDYDVGRGICQHQNREKRDKRKILFVSRVEALCPIALYSPNGFRYQDRRMSRNSPIGLQQFSRLIASELNQYIKANPQVSLRELAKQVGVSSTTISRWRSGQTNVASDYQQRLLDALGISLDALARKLNRDSITPDQLPQIKARGAVRPKAGRGRAESAGSRRKFVVFVSSVVSEFPSLREELWESIYKAGHIPVVLEKYPAIPGDMRQFIADEIADSDVFVFILGWEYGDSPDGESPAEIDEALDQAISLKIPIIFLEAMYQQPRESQPLAPEATLIESRYHRLRARAETHAKRTIRFHPPEKGEAGRYGELKQDFTNALRDLTASLSRGGWVRGEWYDRQSEEVSLTRAVSENPFFVRFLERLNSFQLLSTRTMSSRDQKEIMARYFWDIFLSRLFVCDINRLFFESGSTIAYLSYEFLTRMARPWVREQIAKKEFAIDTNNILTYLDFVLAKPDADPVKCRLNPPGPADLRYGATFGRLTSLLEMWPPTSPRDLSADAAEAVASMSRTLGCDANTLILMTASGLDNSTDGFKGPHVGSYYNKLFRRLLLTNDSPTVLLLEEAKVFKKFPTGECFPVCDAAGSATWEAIRHETPLAIMTCATKARIEDRTRKLDELGFSIQTTGSPSGGVGISRDTNLQCILAANRRFADRFELPE